MKNFTANWKTSLGGLLTMIVGIAALFGVHVGNTPLDPTAAIGMITGGLGLLFAKDGNVTGGTKQQ